MKALITGAEGMLGMDLSPVLEDYGYEVLEFGHNKLDILNSKKVCEVIREEKPDIIFHCAAYTNVDNAEADYEKAYAVNVTGTENIAKASEENGAVLIYISTDYVFDGEKTTPYAPQNAVNPINNYGLTKLKGEEAVKKICSKYYIIRTSWLYGHHGKNFVETMLSLKDKEEIKVVDDQIGCPTWTVELAEGIIKVLNKPYGIYHICGSGSASRYEFAKEIFKQRGIKANITPCKTEDFPCIAKRPKYSVMDNSGLCKDWHISLEDYLALRVED